MHWLPLYNKDAGSFLIEIAYYTGCHRAVYFNPLELEKWSLLNASKHVLVTGDIEKVTCLECLENYILYLRRKIDVQRSVDAKNKQLAMNEKSMENFMSR